MLLALLSAFLAAESLAAAPQRLPSLSTVIPQDLQSAFALPPEAEPVPSVPGVPLSAAAGARVLQEVRVDLPSLYNRHLRGPETVGEGGEKFTLSTQLDRKGDAYLSVQGEDWAEPWFFAIESGMEARWQSAGGAAYVATIDGSIFRRRFNNLLVVRDEKTGQEVLRRRLSDFFNSAAVLGETVTVGGKTYKLFYSHWLDFSRAPARFDRSSHGLCLLYDKSDDPRYHEYKSTPVRFEAVQGAEPAAVRLQDGQVLYLKLAEDGKTLVISD
ncbi:MAG: hypothetical protein PHU21_11830 [Elusimicrobia bacterium]|nr:hypothetical protein [Elusimicrobiota bacterium]